MEGSYFFPQKKSAEFHNINIKMGGGTRLNFHHFHYFHSPTVKNIFTLYLRQGVKNNALRQNIFKNSDIRGINGFEQSGSANHFSTKLNADFLHQGEWRFPTGKNENIGIRYFQLFFTLLH